MIQLMNTDGSETAVETVTEGEEIQARFRNTFRMGYEYLGGPIEQAMSAREQLQPMIEYYNANAVALQKLIDRQNISDFRRQLGEFLSNFEE